MKLSSTAVERIVLIIAILMISFIVFTDRYSGYRDYSMGNSKGIHIIATADSPESHARGLMHRREPLPDASGMLFIYDPPRETSMWMKNTYIPLDVLYLDSSRRVVHIKRNMVPHSLEGHPSTVPVGYAIEINGGESNRLGIKPGTTIEFLT